MFDRLLCLKKSIPTVAEHNQLCPYYALSKGLRIARNSANEHLAANTPKMTDFLISLIIKVLKFSMYFSYSKPHKYSHIYTLFETFFNEYTENLTHFSKSGRHLRVVSIVENFLCTMFTQFSAKDIFLTPKICHLHLSFPRFLSLELKNRGREKF